MQVGQDLLRSVALGSLLSPIVLHHGEMRFREENQIYQILRKVINNDHFAHFEREFLRKVSILGKLFIDLAQRKAKRGDLNRKRASCFPEGSAVEQNCFWDTTASQDQFQAVRIRALPLMVNTKCLGRLEKQSGFGHISFL